MLGANAALTKAWMVRVPRVLRVSSPEATPASVRCRQTRRKRRAAAPPAPEMACLRVAHHVELAGGRDGFAPVAPGGVASGEEKQNLRLQRVGILKFVHENALVVPLELGARAIMLQQVAGVEQQIHEVELSGQFLLP